MTTVSSRTVNAAQEEATGRCGDWMQTVTGKAFWPLDPRPEDIDIEDIAHALAMLSRFGGHTSRFYSVAEHSYHVSQCVPREHAFQALLHDATEAYVGDVIRPIKHMLPAYQDIESGVWAAIAMRFDVPFKMHTSVKFADNAVLLAEKRALLTEPPIPWYWAYGLEEAPVVIVGWTPTNAKALFMNRFEELA